mmetsp:Transcript_17721/g.37226  ORF Transcript_17721/g.37226 Transcript_17721/m.37226 type:complete len:208 (+) Transcript_17721:72-695(+)
MMNFATTLTLAIVALIASTTNAISFNDVETTCDNGPIFSDQDITVVCEGDSTCTFGQTASITGTITADAAFSDSSVTLQPCLYGTICSNEYSSTVGSVCDWLTPAGEGMECGDAGEYSVDYEVEIPSSDDVPNYLAWLSNVIVVKIIVGSGEECEGEAEPEMEMAYGMVGLGSLLVGAVAFEARRRRRVKNDDKAVPFVEMGSATLV